MFWETVLCVKFQSLRRTSLICGDTKAPWGGSLQQSDGYRESSEFPVLTVLSHVHTGILSEAPSPPRLQGLGEQSPAPHVGHKGCLFIRCWRHHTHLSPRCLTVFTTLGEKAHFP